MSWRIWIKIGTRGLFRSLNTNLRLNIDIRYVFSEPKKPLVPTLIEIRQFIRFFQILIHHIGSAISKFQIFTSNSYSTTLITPWYQFSSKSANSLDFSKFLVAILDQPFRILTPNSYLAAKITPQYQFSIKFIQQNVPHILGSLRFSVCTVKELNHYLMFSSFLSFQYSLGSMAKITKRNPIQADPRHSKIISNQSKKLSESFFMQIG